VASALTRFEELIQNPSLTMHLEQTTSLVIAGASRTISGVFNYRMDRSGGDYAATVFFPRVGRTVELRGVAGIDYAREGSSGWVTVPVDPAIASELGNPWQCLGPLDKLQPLNRITNPREAFIFGNSGPIEYLTAELRAQGFEGHITSLRFVVRPDGIPIEVTFNGEASAPGGTVTFASTLTASRVGEDITIDQPVP
jgi:hypothetical protein